MTAPRRRWSSSLPELLLGAAVVCAWAASIAWSSKESDKYPQGGCIYPFECRSSSEISACRSVDTEVRGDAP